MNLDWFLHRSNKKECTDSVDLFLSDQNPEYKFFELIWDILWEQVPFLMLPQTVFLISRSQKTRSYKRWTGFKIPRDTKISKQPAGCKLEHTSNLTEHVRLQELLLLKIIEDLCVHISVNVISASISVKKIKNTHQLHVTCWSCEQQWGVTLKTFSCLSAGWGNVKYNSPIGTSTKRNIMITICITPDMTSLST